MDDDSLIKQGLVKPAANANEADETLLIYLFYHQTDLIRMGIDHNRWAVSLFRGNEIAKLVHSHLIYIRRDLFPYDLLHRPFPSGYAVGVAQLFQQ